MRTTPAPLIDVRRSDDRSETNATWLRDRHSFWVGGRPYDPGNTHHGLLLVHNEDTIRPGAGFGAPGTSAESATPTPYT
ncbi:hypothetical protein ACWDBD_31225 [Streptomyces sp. NPDC001118]|uniref:hypothetical protein n=1 Tax=Streptomyces sp. CG1 TaxID=1287523 RepID=UPI0034E2B99E